MPICNDCALAADGYEHATFLKWALQRWHNKDGTPAKAGHAACKGDTHCDCQHKPKGAWRGER